MIFFFIMPFTIGGLTNLLLPYILYVPDMAFPRLNNLSFWVVFMAFFMAFTSTVVFLGAFGGWTLYAPLTLYPYSASYSVDCVIFSLHLGGFSIILSAINFLVSIWLLEVRVSSVSGVFIVFLLTFFFLLLLVVPTLVASLSIVFLERGMNIKLLFFCFSFYLNLLWFFSCEYFKSFFILIIVLILNSSSLYRVKFLNCYKLGIIKFFSIFFLRLAFSFLIFLEGSNLDFLFYTNIICLIFGLPYLFRFLIFIVRYPNKLKWFKAKKFSLLKIKLVFSI